jgi:hypothetical protein
MHISTHSTPLSVLVKYFNTFVEEVKIIGIQPKTFTGFLTDEVLKSANDLILMLKKSDISSIQNLEN